MVSIAVNLIRFLRIRYCQSLGGVVAVYILLIKLCMVKERKRMGSSITLLLDNLYTNNDCIIRRVQYNIRFNISPKTLN